MIEDLEGAVPEPRRRPHVIALSSAVAAASLALFVALVVPPSRDGAALRTALPAPSASVPVMPIVSGPTMFFQSGPLPVMRVDEMRVDEMRVDEMHVIECADGSWLESPFTLVLDRNGQVLAAYSNGRTQRSVPTPPVGDRGTGWLSVPCATSNVPVPRIDRAR